MKLRKGSAASSVYCLTFVGIALVAWTQERLLFGRILGVDDRRQEQPFWDDEPQVERPSNVTINSDKLERTTRIARIVEKYGFVNKTAATTLLQVIDKQIQNGPLVDTTNSNNNDLYYFYHPPKTGGTSISNLMKDIFGPDSVVPASAASGWFHRQLMEETIQKALRDNPRLTPRAWWQSQKVLYTHSELSEVKENVPFHTWLESAMQGSGKQLKLMTMIRNPLDRIASSFNDHICEIAGRLRHAKLTVVDSPRDACLGLDHRNLTFLADLWLDGFFKPNCQHDRNKLSGSFQSRLCNDVWKEMEKSGLSEKDFFDSLQDPRPHCRSIPAFLESSQYQEEHNFFLQTILPSLASSSAEKSRDLKETSVSSPLIETIEAEALRQLGGLKGAMGHPTAPMVWFGITERMEESLELLHYTLGMPPPVVGSLRTDRVQPCRPVNWFQDAQHRQIITQREQAEFAIHRAANAIMDLRLDNMCAAARSGSPDLCHSILQT